MTSATLHSKDNCIQRALGSRGAGRDTACSGVTGDFIDETVAIWQPQADRALTREDGRETIENVTGFFRVLREWDRIDRANRSGRTTSSHNNGGTVD
jgi:hypothetical protein